MSKMDSTSLNTALEVAQWYNSLKETNNSHFVKLFFDESRYLVLKGGGGSGKSIFAGRKILERCVSERDHRFLVCRKVGKTIRESCYTQLVGQLAEHYPNVNRDINRGDMRIKFPDTNSEIIFSGLDDVEKLKSIYNITGIWIEEASELLEGDFNQLDIRLRGETKYYKQIIISFNPISIVHWLKQRFFDREDPKATVHESTYLDNRFLDDEARRVLEDFKDTDDYYYQVYCLGNWGVTGKTVFDGQAVSRRIGEITEPLKRGYMAYGYDGIKLTDIRFIEDQKGPIRIYEEPKKGHHYTIGVDTAGDGSDSCVAQCVNNVNMNQAFSLISVNIDEDELARQVYCLGMWYHEALIAVESNFSTYPIRELERLEYPHQYVRETFDNYNHKVDQRFGFRTDTRTRNVIIANLIKLVREDVSFVNDKTTLEEMLTFIRNDKTFRPEAEQGAHDDTIMALAIACHVRNSGQTELAVEEEDQSFVSEWTYSMYEDFYNASEEEQEMLLKKWGVPRNWN